MTIFVGIVRYEIDDKNCIGVGGEATVFPINNTTAIKIYKNPDIFKESKIRHMLSMSVDNTLRSFAAVSYTHLDVYKRQPLDSALQRYFYLHRHRHISLCDCFGLHLQHQK